MFIGSVTGDFKDKIVARRDAWKGQKIGAVVYAPDSLRWWIYQEYGTASRGEFGGAPYSIDPVNAKTLAFPGADGTTVFREHVEHPGIPPRHPVQKAIPQIEQAMIEVIISAFEDGAADDPTALQEATIQAVTKAKELIVESLAQNIPGTRIDGKLLGQSASSVFEADAIVQSISQGE